MDTTQLLQRCQAGDAAAIETLVQTYQNHMYRIALLLLDDPAEAEEAVQDAFIAAFRALHGFHGDSTLKTWLLAIVVNESRNRLRKRNRVSHLIERLQTFYQTGENPVYPEKNVVRQEESERVWQAVQALGEKHRLPIILRYYQDLPVAEIAQILHIHEGTVHSRLNTARERLRSVLGPVKAEEDE